MGDRQRIGILGGTFDPPHNTHLDIARAALTQANLDVVYFVVSANPPHKRNATCASAEERYALVEAALENEPRMRASRAELERAGPSYTADTLQEFRAAYPDASLFLIIGLDSLVDLPRWREPARILSLAHLLVVPRPGEPEIPSELQGHYTMLSFTETDVSSTEIRQRIASGEPCEDVLPARVAKQIQDRGLYRECVEHPARG